MLQDVVEQLTLELSQSKRLFEQIFDNIDVAIWSLDTQTNLATMSAGYTKLFGLTKERLASNPDAWKQMIYTEDLELTNHHIELVHAGQATTYDHRIVLASGEIRWVECICTPVFDSDSKVIRINGVVLDITPKKAAEQALAESQEKFRLIAENLTDLIALLDVDGILQYASKKSLGYDADWMIGTSGYDYVHPEDLADVQNAIVEVIGTKSNTQLQFRLLPYAGDPLHVDCMATPILDAVGDVENILMVCRDITEKVQIERRLNESEERYRRLIELSPQPIASSSLDGCIEYINPAGTRLLGAERDSELIGKSVSELMHPDFVDIYNDRVRTAMNNEDRGSVEYKIIRLDGKVIEVVAIGIYDAQTDTALLVFTDITDRKAMERSLRESEERYRRLVELSPVAFSVCKNDRFVYMNPAGMCTLGAVHEEQIIGTALLDWIHPDDTDFANELLRNSTPSGYCPSKELQVIRLDGAAVDILVTAFYDVQSETVQILFQDITARKLAERALLESEELNRRLIELSPGVIVFHSDYKYHYVNPAGLTLLGAVSMDHMVDQSLFDNIHSDDIDKAAIRLKGVYEQQTTTPFVEQKIVRFDGGVIDVEVIAASVPYKGINAGLTLIRDITERKKAEQDRKLSEQIIRDSEERYFRLQTSLDRFSHDLFGDMKVSEIERRLMKEVREVTGADKVSVIEVDRDNNLAWKSGYDRISKKILKNIVMLNPRDLPLCQIIDTPDDYLVKIGEFRGKGYLLLIGEKPCNLQITAYQVWLKTITRYVSVLYDNFRLIEDLTRELGELASQQVAPAWLLRLLFNLSESERKRLSQDLHDAALQEQIIWYRKLDVLSTDHTFPQSVREQLQPISQGLLDVVYQIRMTCNELRPPMLKEEGIVSSLEALFEFTQLRTNFYVDFDSCAFHHSLTDDLLIGIYRIVQELLANAGKHSNATRVHITLSSKPDKIQLAYTDNGIGMDVWRLEDSFHSMGVYGMKERVRSMEGEISFHSEPNSGLVVFISIPALALQGMGHE